MSKAFTRSGNGRGAEYVHWLWPVHRLREYMTLYGWLVLLGIGALMWSAAALVLRRLLPEKYGVWLGRRGASSGFRLYLFTLRMAGAARFDLSELDALRGCYPLIIVANHPGLLDAPMVLSRLPNVVCVLKASLIDSPFWGAGSRLARYIRNDWFVGSMNLAADELRKGCHLLLFPEGTRTDVMPLGEFRMGAAYISHRTGVPIQTVMIEQDTPFLGKSHPLLKRPDMPMHFRIRLGQCFDPPNDPREFTKVLHAYFLRELQDCVRTDEP